MFIAIFLDVAGVCFFHFVSRSKNWLFPLCERRSPKLVECKTQSEYSVVQNTSKTKVILTPAKSINKLRTWWGDKMLFFISVILYPSVQGEKFTDELSIFVLAVDWGKSKILRF